MSETEYSDEVAGAPRNYKAPVRFDITDGFVGITQKDSNGKVVDRVLLSPTQVKKLIAWLEDR